jgi:hypothetical protein
MANFLFADDTLGTNFSAMRLVLVAPKFVNRSTSAAAKNV